MPALAALARAVFIETFVDGLSLGYPPADLETFLSSAYAPTAVAGWVADPGSLVLVAEQGGELVAYAHGGENGLPVADGVPGDGEVKRLYVRRAAQGMGLGRALLQQVLDWLRPRRVFIGVWSGNAKAQRLYGHYGFKVVGEYKFKVGDTLDDELIMGR